MGTSISRRDALRLLGIGAASTILAACGVDATKFPDPTATPSQLPPTAMPTIRPEATATGTTAAPATPDIRNLATPVVRERMCTPPKSVKEIADRGVKIASPASNPEQFARDMGVYNKVLYGEILPGYSGAEISIPNKDLGVGPEELMIRSGANVQPVASAFFEEDGQHVAMVSLPVKCKNGERSALHVILTPDIDVPSDERRITDPDEILGRLPGKVADNKLSSITTGHQPLKGNMGMYNTNYTDKHHSQPANVGLGQVLREAIIDGKPIPQDEKRAVVTAAWFFPKG